MRFEWVVAGLEQGADINCDVDLLGNPAAAVVPSLGSIVAGWLLVIPRIRSLNIASLPSEIQNEILRVGQAAAISHSRFAGRTVFFEHGASSPNTLLGCGVEQAHLHAVPVDGDIFASVTSDESVEWREVDRFNPWADLSGQKEYYIIYDGQTAYAGTPKVQQSQFFRRHIAKIAGDESRWNYRQWPFYGNVAQTIVEYRAHSELLAA